MSSYQQSPTPASTRKASRRIMGGLIGLLVIAGGTTAVVSLVEQFTRERIAANQAARTMKVVAEVLPSSGHDHEPREEIYQGANSLIPGSQKPLPTYFASIDNTPVATVLTLEAPDGYIAPIRLLIGIDNEGSIIAVRALQHLETPGLGDQIDADKTDWIAQFNGRKQSDDSVPLALRRDGGDLDHISGATITSRAVTNAISNGLKYYAENRQRLLAPIIESGSATQELQR
ncbi:MAG: RnfABCDGE type electron transport complex subunit G [Gammaproteobacteria bacterium]|nr:MAG: RnfABCDGE type electron transport complex subunit G [Gammaproteobacteria bacterium]